MPTGTRRAQLTAIPAEITAAILAVRKSVRSLKTDAFNKHDNYSYVSIDTYYEKVATLANEAGLVWRGRQTECTLIEGQGKTKDRLYMRITMSYDVMAGAASVDHYSSFTILLPHSGAQTTGIAVSYADKVFMRTTFCVPTGEQDADAEPSGQPLVKQYDPLLDVPEAPPVRPASISTQEDAPITLPPRVRPGSKPAHDEDGVIPEVDPNIFPSFGGGMPIATKAQVNAKSIGILVETFKTFMPLCKSVTGLKAWHADNAGVLDLIQSIDPTARTKIQGMFSARFEQLNK